MVKSSSGSTGRAGTAGTVTTDITITTDIKSRDEEDEGEDENVEATLVSTGPLKAARSPASGRGKNIPSSAAKSVVAAGAGKTDGKVTSSKRMYSRSPAEGEESDEESSSPKVSSRSRSGHSSSVSLLSYA